MADNIVWIDNFREIIIYEEVSLTKFKLKSIIFLEKLSYDITLESDTIASSGKFTFIFMKLPSQLVIYQCSEYFNSISFKSLLFFLALIEIVVPFDFFNLKFIALYQIKLLIFAGCFIFQSKNTFTFPYQSISLTIALIFPVSFYLFTRIPLKVKL